jgi:hypothetical protein
MQKWDRVRALTERKYKTQTRNPPKKRFRQTVFVNNPIYSRVEGFPLKI